MAIELLLVLAQAASPPPAQRELEINTALMQSTFHLQGPSKTTGEIAVGSGVVVGRPCAGVPGKGAYTLVSVSHVLEQIAGEDLLILVRLKNPDGTWRKVRHFVKSRTPGGKPLWLKHPDADVAVMYVNLPEGAVPECLPAAMFATDAVLQEFEIHPGDEVFALGFPLGVEANQYGFPVLRSGRIASYPLLPQKSIKTFLVDMEAFPGNSGGPVYLWDRNRSYAGGTHIGEVRFLMGIVRGTVFARDPASTRLVIAEVVHANFVLEAISLLPEPACSK